MRKYLTLGYLVFSSQIYAENACNAIIQSDAFNTTDYSSSAKLLLKKRDDVCDKEYNSESEAKSAARSAGGSIGFGGFSLGGSSSKQTSTGKWSLSNSDFCKASAAELDSMTSKTMRVQVTDLAVNAWRACTAETSKLSIEYTQNDDGSGITGRIVRSIAGPHGAGIGTITGMLNSKPDVHVSCTIGTEPIEMNKKINIKFDRTHTSFFCNKPRDKDTKFSLTTDQGDHAWIELYSDTKNKQTKMHEINNSINLINAKIDDARRVLEASVVSTINNCSDLGKGWSNYDLANNRFLMGANGGETNIQGGENQLTIKIENLPSHAHSYNDVYYSIDAKTEGNATKVEVPGKLGSSKHDSNNWGHQMARNTKKSGGVDKAKKINITPPFVTVNFCKYDNT